MTPEEAIKKLQEFWLLSSSEYSIIKELLQERIDGQDIVISTYPGGTEDEERMHHEDINLRDFYIMMREKVSYVISKGLCSPR